MARAIDVAADEFIPLVSVLDGWFERTLSDLPPAARERVERSGIVLQQWDPFSPFQRRLAAEQWDFQTDPAQSIQRKRLWKLVLDEREIESQITAWREAKAGTAADLFAKEVRLAALAADLKRTRIKMRRLSAAHSPVSQGKQERTRTNSSHGFIAFPKALSRLESRLHASAPELAAWIFLTTKIGGIAAYSNANEFDPPPRFFFSDAMGHDYLSAITGCWFREDDVDLFEPDDRYITGSALIARWEVVLGAEAAAFVLKKVGESRLTDIHPTFGGTEATDPSLPGFPPITSGLFALSEIVAIEDEDFERPLHAAVLAVSGEQHGSAQNSARQSQRAGGRMQHQAARNAAIRTKYEELRRAGYRNYVKEIQRVVEGADILSARTVRRIASTAEAGS